jgi:hypothetical protein
MADMPGPTFWHLDGCNMDHDFAFDIYHLTREEWEAEERVQEEMHKQFEAKWAERERLGVTDSRSAVEGGIWQRSFAVGDNAAVPLGMRVFGIGCHLAELITGLRGDVKRDAVPGLARGIGDQAADAELGTQVVNPRP